MRKSFSAVCAAALLGPLAVPAAAGEISIDLDSVTTACAAAAKVGVADDQSLRTCDNAVAKNVWDAHNRASNYVNRGVLLIARGAYGMAAEDFEAAMAIKPNLAEAYLNRGAARLRQNRPQEALADIDRGLQLGPEAPARAYFNRAVARERLGDLNGAYQDYKRAERLAPTWSWPKEALAGFTVVRRTNG